MSSEPVEDDIRIQLSGVFENEAKTYEGLTSPMHVKAKLLLEELSEYVLDLPDNDPHLTPFLLLRRQTN